jgi:hypothetical protein
VRLTAGGVHGWSLWFSGERDVLLARGGRIPLFASPDALLAAVSTTPEAFTMQGAPRLGSVELRQVLDAHPASFDLDAAAEWFARPEREADMAACERALNAINMATDIGATTGDDGISALITSDARLWARSTL